MNQFIHISLATALGVVATNSAALAQSKTYTTNSDFDLGVLSGVNHNPPNRNQLQLNESDAPFSILSVACGGLDTVVRINTATGAILGEYRTVPGALDGDPSRATTDMEGSCWVGNRLEDGDGVSVFGSVTKVGVVVGGTRVDGLGNPDPLGNYIINWDLVASTCIDRDNDGRIRTSNGLGDVLNWPDITDGLGGNPAFVQDAEDECILIFQRTIPERIRHLSIDANNDLWAGGYPTFPTSFDQLNGLDGSFIQNKTAVPPGCGGYAGLVDNAGVLWSTSELEGQLFRCDLPGGTPATCITVQANVRGIAMAPDGFLWTAGGTQLCRVSPDGQNVQFFNPAGASQLHGIAIDPSNGELWVASSGTNEVFRLSSTATLIAKIPAGVQARGVDMDMTGKIWVANQGSDDVMRIDPATNLVDLTVPLRPGSNPYNPSDMVGALTYNTSSDAGMWTVVTDGGQSGTQWSKVSWNGSEPRNSSLTTFVRSSDSLAGLMVQPFAPTTNGGVIAEVGRFLEVRVDFMRSTMGGASPILFDLSVVGENIGTGDPCAKPNRREPASLLIYPEFDNLTGSTTVLTLTNVNSSMSGTLAVEFVYIDGEDCHEFNRTEYLTANDTLTLLTKSHNPGQERGYVYVFAKDAATGAPIVANSLIGEIFVITAARDVCDAPGGAGCLGPGSFDAEYAINAVGFKAIGANGLTDLDMDGLLDLDGLEYEQAPDSILIPRFLGQTGAPTFATSELVMIGLTGGVQFDTTLDFLIYNDNEQGFSAEYTFHCWDRVPLLAISGVFDGNYLLHNTNDDSAEILGATFLQAGWMRINGAVASSMTTSIPDPAFLAFLIEHLSDKSGADLPFELCTQPGGVLLPTGQGGGL